MNAYSRVTMTRRSLPRFKSFSLIVQSARRVHIAARRRATNYCVAIIAIAVARNFGRCIKMPRLFTTRSGVLQTREENRLFEEFLTTRELQQNCAHRASGAKGPGTGSAYKSPACPLCGARKRV